jgi:hypothetical protein
MAINKDTLYSYNVDQTSSVSASWDSAVGAQADNRRIHDFSDRVHELAPEESPFFVYLTQMSKSPTNDPVFRFLENRSKIDWTSRNFNISTGGASAPGTVVAGTSYSFSVDDGASSSIDWLIKGMVFAVESSNSDQVVVRIETAPVDTGNDTTFTGKVISFSNNDTGNAIADNDRCQVIGTAFAEGSGSPDVWSSQLEDDFGYTQIFKTAAEMTNTAIATNYRGYANEWNRIWNLKLREHKVDIERAMLFSQRGRSSNVQYTEGIVGSILKNSTSAASGSLSYTSGASYLASQAASAVTYDTILSDFEVVFDPARGGGSSKLGLASLPVISFFNKLGGFFDTGVAALGPGSGGSGFSLDVQNIQGRFGHKLMAIDTVHGTLNLTKEPLFRGISSGFMLCCDLSQIAYRPLVGNGLNRDTHIVTNVQQADEDLRKDMIITEAGLEVSLPETHLLYNFTDL